MTNEERTALLERYDAGHTVLDEDRMALKYVHTWPDRNGGQFHLALIKSMKKDDSGKAINRSTGKNRYHSIVVCGQELINLRDALCRVTGTVAVPKED